MGPGEASGWNWTVKQFGRLYFRVWPPVLQALHAALVHVDVGHLRHRRIHALGGDHVAVVLAGDVGPAVLQILHRVVAPPVAEAHLPGLRPGGQGQQLVPQADGEEGQVGVVEFPNLFDDLRVVRRVAGAVGEHHPVKAAGQNGLRRGVGGEHGDLTPPVLEAADHVLLHAVVHQGHPQLLFPRGGVHLGLLAGHLLHGALHPVGVDALERLLDRKMLRTGDHAIHGPLTAEYSG